MKDSNLIAGMESSEDAGVYKLSDELAVVQTVDFFTPIVDSPHAFGQIAVANALSDIYAKGGKPLTAMNIVCFPIKTMDMSVLKEILAGGLEKMREAGVILVGGHTVEDNELKYGLSVTGTIHPSRMIRNTGAKTGDKLILTKPLGIGIITTAIKGGMADEETIHKATVSMATLNSKASELMLEVGVDACTDVTGFGLLGHACEMVENTEVGMIIDSAAVPYFAEARELAGMGFVPGGLYRNRDFRSPMVDISQQVPAYMVDILFDPQTSGGLLIATPADHAPALLKAMHEKGVSDAAVIGRVVEAPKGRIQVI